MKLIIWQEREQRQWTQEFVAHKVGLTRTAISDIENGKAKPSYEILVKLENLFQMSHRKLFVEVAYESFKHETL